MAREKSWGVCLQLKEGRAKAEHLKGQHRSSSGARKKNAEGRELPATVASPLFLGWGTALEYRLGWGIWVPRRLVQRAGIIPRRKKQSHRENSQELGGIYFT